MAGPLTHAMLGFEVKGGWRDVKGSVAMTALQYLMGGGGSFSAGGPGMQCMKQRHVKMSCAVVWPRCAILTTHA